jgi:putative SOS response-associated peptidase YedK
MCSHYVAEKAAAKLRRMGLRLPPDWQPPPGNPHIYPTQVAPIIRRVLPGEASDESMLEMEVFDAHFGMLPEFAKEIKYGLRTYNARSETVAGLASFKAAWARCQHCIVPAESFYEPDWRSGRHVPTRILRSDGETLGIAGLWAEWRHPSGELVNSFTMLTINADRHPIFRHLHRPDPKLSPQSQDKRMVVVLNESDYGPWLGATAQQSREFLVQYPADKLIAAPEFLDPQGDLGF